MKIEKFKKMSKGRYKISLDRGDEFILYEDVIFKHSLLLQKEISLEKLDKLLEDNKYYEAYNLALSYIEYKLRSKKEIEDYLDKKEYTHKLINDIINDLESKGYINDRIYAKAFILDKINFTNHGPYKIKQALLSSGVDESIINEELNNIDKDLFIGKINKIIDKRKKINKKPISIFKMKTMEYLSTLGYDRELINNALSITEYEIDEEAILNKAISEKEKLYNKYSKKYEGNKLDYQIKSALYRKGYNSEIINKIMD